MQQVDPYDGLGVVALDEEDLAAIRGGLGGFFTALVAGLVVAVLVEFDEFVAGFQEGYAYARGT